MRSGRGTHGGAPAGVLLVALLLPCLRGAAAEESRPGTAPAADAAAAESAVRALRAGLRSKAAEDRLRAVREHGRVAHGSVTDELLRALRRSAEPDVRTEVIMALAAQRPSARKVVPAIERWIAESAASQVRRQRRGDPGFPLDPRTGEPALDTPEGRASLAVLEARAAGLREAIRCLRSLRDEPPKDVGEWAVLLSDPSDALVVEVLDAFAAWRTTAALPALLDLFRCYPSADRWETGAVVDLAGNDASAKRAWTATFGHPGRRRARPEVHAALVRALRATTGRTFEDPAALAAHLATAAARK